VACPRLVAAALLQLIRWSGNGSGSVLRSTGPRPVGAWTATRWSGWCSRWSSNAPWSRGYGSSYLARQVGQKRAREIFFLGREYDAGAAQRISMGNEVVPHAVLEAVALEWALTICAKSPTAQHVLKFAFNAVDDGLVGH